MDVEVQRVNLSYEIDNTDPSLDVGFISSVFDVSYIATTYDVGFISPIFDVSYIATTYDISYINVTPTTIEIGIFLLKEYALDYISTGDRYSTNVGKNIGELGNFETALRYNFNRPLDETIGISDTSVKSVGSVHTDNFSAADQVDTLGFFKRVTDLGAVATETAITLAKLLTDSLYATDDIDGEASIEDDQNLVFFKSRTNHGNVFENNVKSVSTVRSDSGFVTDSGSLFGQDYVDNPFYFAEDYVGYSTTF